MSSATTNFKLNPDQVLGFSYQEYISSVRGIAISTPGEYYKARAQLMQSLKRAAVGNLYQLIYEVLSDGTIHSSAATTTTGCILGRAPLVPNYPPQKINDYAISCASILGEELNKIIDLLLPDDFEKIAASKLTIQGRSKAVEDVIV